MGVQLGELVQKEEIPLEALSGRRIAIDAYNAIYQFLSIIRQRDGTPLLDLKGRVTSHLSGLFYRTARLIEIGIKPIYVFDGKPPELKRDVIIHRAEVRELAESKRKEALEKGDIEEARMYAQAASKLTLEMAEESKKLLTLMGVPYVQAPSEGESQAAYLAKKGDVYACASQDYDALLFGSPFLIRNLTLTGRRKLPRKNIYVDVVPEIVELDATLEKLGINMERLVWIGILIGTDFSRGVKGIGPKKALKIAKECGSLKEVAEKANIEFESAERIENIFLQPSINKDYSFEFKTPEKEELFEFLCKERAFSEERVKKVMDELSRVVSEKGAQSKLDKWF